MGFIKKLFVVGLLLLGFYATTRYFQNPYIKNPPVSNFQSRIFHNDEGEERTFSEVVRWLLTRQVGAWPEKSIIYPTRVPEKRLPSHKVEVTYVGHATFLIQIAGKNILTDPVWGEAKGPMPFFSPERISPAGIKFEDIPPIDYVMISHNHYDHMDKPTIKKIAERDDPTFITFYGNETLIRQFHPGAHVISFGWWGEAVLDDGESLLKITGCPAHHGSARGLLDRNKALWGGFMIRSTKHQIYFAGDTGYHQGKHFRMIRAKMGQPDIALLPIGAYEPRWMMKAKHMNPEDAVKAHLDLGSRLSVGMHFDVFKGLADEAYHQAEADLSIAKALHKVAGDSFITIAPGRFIEP